MLTLSVKSIKFTRSQSNQIFLLSLYGLVIIFSVKILCVNLISTRALVEGVERQLQAVRKP